MTEELLQQILATNQQILAELQKLNTTNDKQVAMVAKSSGKADQAMDQLMKSFKIRG